MPLRKSTHQTPFSTRPGRCMASISRLSSARWCRARGVNSSVLRLLKVIVISDLLNHYRAIDAVSWSASDLQKSAWVLEIFVAVTSQLKSIDLHAWLRFETQISGISLHRVLSNHAGARRGILPPTNLQTVPLSQSQSPAALRLPLARTNMRLVWL